MDPLSVLGAATGVTSLIFQLVDECVRFYKYFSEASQMPQEYRYLTIKLQIEQQRFLNFALEAGILQTDGNLSASLRVNRSLLLALLAEIKTLMEKHATISGRYERLQHQEEVTHPLDEESEADLMAMQCVSYFGSNHRPSEPEGGKDRYFKQICKFGKSMATSGKNLRKIAVEPKRLVWAVFDKESFEELTFRLDHLNSFLIALLDSSQTRRLQDTMNISYLEILQIRNDIKSLTGLVEALTGSDRDNTKSEVYSFTRTSTDAFTTAIAEENAKTEKRKKYMKQLAEIKIQSTRLDGGLCDDSTTSTLSNSIKRCLDFSLFRLDVDAPNQEQRTNADYNGRSVWIEWKNLAPNHLSPDSIRNVETRMQLLTELLCSEKPEGFRSPPCVGYVKLIASHENVRSTMNPNTRYGIVFGKPPGNASATKLVTLHQLLSEFPRPKPSLSARISLCATISECLRSFHAVNWLHKGLRSDNILFFTQDSVFPDLSMPYVSGFELSRPNSFVEMTERPHFNASQDLYRYPSAQSSLHANSFRKSYDMYSLGVILIEIATWEKVDKIMGFVNLDEVVPIQLREVRPRLLGCPNTPSSEETSANKAQPIHSQFLERVASNFGEVFRTIAEVCLRADEIEKPIYAGESDVYVTVRLQRMMEDVVKRLRALESAMNFSEAA